VLQQRPLAVHEAAASRAGDVVVRLACLAMATRFELVLHGASAPRLRAAGEEAISAIHRLEDRLSFFRARSEVGRINASAASGAVRVTPELFGLLRRARDLNAVTGGRFDITTGPLTRCWRAAHGDAAAPAAELIDAVRACVGMHLVELDEAACSIRFERPGVEIDLGAIGKGYALDEAAAVLREAGVERALLHGGTSSIYGLGAPPDGAAWNVALEWPPAAGESPRESPRERVLALVPLRDRALSVSAVWGRTYQVGNDAFAHVIDPASGLPVTGVLLAAACCSNGADADALATALLVARPGDEPIQLPQGWGAVLVTEGPSGEVSTWSKGMDLFTGSSGSNGK
jgi:FAD:protein FMN transferase